MDIGKETRELRMRFNSTSRAEVEHKKDMRTIRFILQVPGCQDEKIQY